MTPENVEYEQLNRKMYFIAIATTIVNIATLIVLYQLYSRYHFTEVFFSWALSVSGVALLCNAALKKRARLYLEQIDRIVNEDAKHWDSIEINGGQNDK